MKGDREGDDFKLTTFNCRVESCRDAATFKGAFARRRCLAPANAWYEQTGDRPPKPKFRFARADGAPLWFAGLWDRCATRDAGEVKKLFKVGAQRPPSPHPAYARRPVQLTPTVEAAFGGGLVRKGNGKAYVPDGYQGPSLGAVQIASGDVYLHEDTYGEKTRLRALIQDGSDAYDLTVPAEGTVRRWKQVGIEQMRSEVALRKLVHVRLGLARAWADNPCYAQVNGLYLL